MNRRAKIVVTLGPASSSAERIRQLIDAGMDVARLNLSHGERAEHAAVYSRVRAASDASGHAVAILVDLQGPKIRLGRFEGGSAQIRAGDPFTITTQKRPGDSTGCSTSYGALARDVKPGDTLLIDDGNVRLVADSTDGIEVVCTVIEGGRVSDHKGLNLPGVRVSAPSMTEKDREDLRFALSLRVDLIAMSFVRSPDDIRDAHAIMDEVGARLPVIAKIEKPEAVENLAAIIHAFDGLMVARGDLGVEIPLEEVPLVQKLAVRLARDRARPVIVATQMLESMITHSRPTRAEASDVANAILDGADAVMLSGETSVGEFPIETVLTMARIMSTVEAHGVFELAPVAHKSDSRQDAIAAAAVKIAEDTHARALVAFTESGASARRVASHRSTIPLLAFTSEPAVRSQLALQWGIETFVVPRVSHTDDMVEQVNRSMLELGRGAPGDLVVMVAGSPPGAVGSTNMVRVHRLVAE